MTQKLTWILLLALLITACTPSSTPAPTDAPSLPTATPEATPAPIVEAIEQPGRIVISELIPGIAGENNNYEFIELYNAGSEPVDLRGWTLIYKMNADQDARHVFRWSAATDVPSYGHVLLVREGQDVGVVPDAVFSTPLFERQGGLRLLDASGELVDALGWGDAPTDFAGPAPAPAPEGGASLERLPGGTQGNGTDTDTPAADFALRPVPAPQNTGSPITPLPEERLIVAASAPVSVTPGSEFVFTVTVTNATGTDLSTVRVAVPLPEGFVARAFEMPPEAAGPQVGLPEVDSETGDFATPVMWTIPELAAGERTQAYLTLQSPWRYVEARLGGFYAESDDWFLRLYGAPVPLSVSGGTIPIGTARTLEGVVVTVEGVATMYTGGFYAGSTGTKFYLQDETGGIQVYCPGGKDDVRVSVGDRVRVTGGIEIYRDAVEIVPLTYPDDVVVLEEDATVPEPLAISARAATGDEAVLGELIQVEGTVTRLEEFSYSYELDLLDDEGNTVLAYVEKDTRINPEFVEVGQRYRVTGISELYSTQWQLKPRTEDDFARIYPPELMLERLAQNSVEAGGLITYTLTAYNHTAEPLTNVHIVAPRPGNEAARVEALDGGGVGLLGLSWTVPELAPDGGSATVRYVVRLAPDVTDRIEAEPARATADQWPDPATTPPWTTFIGGGVPIWALQGEGAASPFVRSVATTEGVVTGVFPEQGGFWIQSLEPDQDPATSEGLFVLTQALDVSVASGDSVRVTGKIREKSGQTLLHLKSADDLEVLESELALPAAVELAPPSDEAASRAYYEALEGMLVSVTEPAVAIAPTSKYGEYVLVRAAEGVERIYKGEPRGAMIFVDDGSAEEHADRSTLLYAVATGDQVGGLLGPLAFTYDNYKIQPIITPTLITQPQSLPALAPAGPAELSIATFNIENFFDVKPPHPSSPPPPGIREYQLKVARTVSAVVAMGAPDVIGFQEVENVGVLEDLVEDPALAGYGYVPVLVEGFDSRGIDVGYLVRGDRVTVEGVGQYDAPEGLTSRPPLVITVTARLASGEHTIHVINNHFTSMAGGELATEPRRNAQAAWNVTLVQQLQAENPEAHIVVLGDLNSFYQSPPLDTLRAGGLRHVYELVEPALPYTYIYQGESETLDHILVTPSLYEQLVRVAPLHINADSPPPRPGDPAPARVSDHDPLVAVFAFEE